MNKLFFTLLTFVGIMYAYNVFAIDVPEGDGCDTSDKTACYVLVVGQKSPSSSISKLVQKFTI